MKLNLILSFILCVAFAGCTSPSTSPQSTSSSRSSDTGVLTPEKAQRAMDTFARQQQGTLTLKGGVREIPSENIAKAECEFHGIHYNRNGEDRIISDTYEGTNLRPTCTVGFTHYTDGRWVLTRVTIGDTDAREWKLNLEAN